MGTDPRQFVESSVNRKAPGSHLLRGPGNSKCELKRGKWLTLPLLGMRADGSCNAQLCSVLEKRSRKTDSLSTRGENRTPEMARRNPAKLSILGSPFQSV
jgi:hypothetical protein